MVEAELASSSTFALNARIFDAKAYVLRFEEEIGSFEEKIWSGGISRSSIMIKPGSSSGLKIIMSWKDVTATSKLIKSSEAIRAGEPNVI